MTDPGIQHWEAEMDYIGDMLGIDEKPAAESADETATPEELPQKEKEPEMQAWQDPLDLGTRPEYTDKETAGIADELQQLTPVDAIESKATVPDGDVANMYQLVSVAGIKVALPLLAIRHVLDSEVDASSGSLGHMGADYRLVDVHGLFRPGETAEPSAYVLVEPQRIAIACEEILDMVSIERFEVCWRDENSQRGWLSGTVKSKGIALIELDQL